MADKNPSGEASSGSGKVTTAEKGVFVDSDYDMLSFGIKNEPSDTCEASTPTTNGPPAKRNRVEITARHKREICVYKQYHPKTTYEELATHCQTRWNLKIGRSTLSDIIRQKDKWLNITPDQEDLMRARGGRHHKLETELVKRLAILRQLHPKMAFTEKVIIDQAKQIGQRLNIKKSFSYSKGWLIKFKKRQGLNTKDGNEFSRRLSDMQFDDDLSLLDGTEEIVSGHFIDDYKNGSGADNDNNSEHVTHSWSFLGSFRNSNGPGTSGYDYNPHSPLPDSVVIKQETSSNDGKYVLKNDSDVEELDVGEEDQNHSQWDEDKSSTPSFDTNNTHDRRYETDQAGAFPASMQTQQNVVQSDISPEERSFGDQGHPSSSTTPYITSPFVSVQEAKHCVVRCIRYFENHPESGDHLNGLWDAFHAIDSQPIQVLPKTRTMEDYFKKK